VFSLFSKIESGGWPGRLQWESILPLAASVWLTQEVLPMSHQVILAMQSFRELADAVVMGMVSLWGVIHIFNKLFLSK
jgi:hypothetical protein